MNNGAAPMSGCRIATKRIAGPDPTSVFVADGHRVAREGMRAYFTMVDDIAVTGEAADGRDALDQLATMARRGELPRVVLVSLSLPSEGGLAVTQALTRSWPRVAVVVLTSFVDDSTVRSVFAAGATGYLVKETAEADDIARMIRSGADGAEFTCEAPANA